MTTTTATITAQQILDLGGREWIGGNGQRRIYLNEWHELAGLEISRYKSGNISYAAVNGERISNNRARVLASASVWWDVDAGELRHTIRSAAESARLDDVADALIDNLLASCRRSGARALSAAQAAQELGDAARSVGRRHAAGKISASKHSRGHWVVSL